MKLTASSVLLYLSSIKNIADANVDCSSLKVPEACEAVGCTWRGTGLGVSDPGLPPGVCFVNCNDVQEQKDCDRVKECRWQFGLPSGFCVVDVDIKRSSSQVTEEDPVKMEEASGSSHAGVMFSTLLVGYFVAYWA